MLFKHDFQGEALVNCQINRLFPPLSQSLMLQIAATRLEEEEAAAIAAKEQHLNESCPALTFPSSVEELQVGQVQEHLFTSRKVFCCK